MKKLLYALGILTPNMYYTFKTGAETITPIEAIPIIEIGEANLLRKDFDPLKSMPMRSDYTRQAISIDLKNGDTVYNEKGINEVTKNIVQSKDMEGNQVYHIEYGSIHKKDIEDLRELLAIDRRGKVFKTAQLAK